MITCLQLIFTVGLFLTIFTAGVVSLVILRKEKTDVVFRSRSDFGSGDRGRLL